MKVKNYLFGFLLLLLLMVQTPPAVAKADDAYTITSYTVSVNVTREKLCHVQEDIQVYFHTPRHGIYRNIPLSYTISRADGSTDRGRSKVSRVQCNASYTTSRQQGNYQIKIGDANTTVTGEQHYSISYDYSMGKDPLKDVDEFYYNLIGTEWDTTINQVQFSVTMPSAIDQEKVGLSYGSYGEERFENLQYVVQDNVLAGFLDPSVTLMPGEGLTVRMELPEGYFVYHPEFPTAAVGSILIAVIGVIISYLLWQYYGKDDPVIEVIEFYPPAALNSLETALAYKGKVDGEDVVSLIVYLAQKGYIRIDEKGKKDFVLTKLKDYDGNNTVERMFMSELFARLPVVEKADLKNKFYKSINKILRVVNSKRNRRVLFYDSSMNKNWIFYIMAVLSFVMAFYHPMVEDGMDPYNALVTPLIMGGVFVLVIRLILQPGKLSGKLYMIIWSFAFFGVSGLMLFQSIMYADPPYLVACIVCMIATVVIMLFLHIMPKRTEYGTKILGYIRGFREFLETAEKDRLEALVEENPQYFYDILPYTYVLDVSDKWMDKFEGIDMEPPHWYHSTTHTAFHMASFSRGMQQTMKAANASMNSSPSGGHGGGGHAGGGGGGGGGGSW